MDCIALGGHCYVLTLVDRATRFTWTYGMRALSGSDFIQAIQEFGLDTARLTSKL